MAHTHQYTIRIIWKPCDANLPHVCVVKAQSSESTTLKRSNRPTDRKPSNLRQRRHTTSKHTSNSVAVRVSERESTNCVWWKRVSSNENEKRVARPLLECRNNTITWTRARGTHKPRRSLVLAFKCHQQYSICHHTVWDRDRVSGALSLNQKQSHFILASVSFLYYILVRCILVKIRRLNSPFWTWASEIDWKCGLFVGFGYLTVFSDVSVFFSVEYKTKLSFSLCNENICGIGIGNSSKVRQIEKENDHKRQ